jgi:hypothetical protein
MIIHECEICNEKMECLLEKHHIHSKSLGGSDKKYNIANICSRCHKLVHNGLVIIEGRFDTTSGNKVVWRKYNEENITGIKEPNVWLLPNAAIHRISQ